MQAFGAGLVRASVSAIFQGSVRPDLSCLGEDGPYSLSGIGSWMRNGKHLRLEIEDPSLGRLGLTLDPAKEKR